MKAEIELERLAQRGDPNMPDDLVWRRVAAALHEAAHFIVAVREGIEVYAVEIVSAKGRGPDSGISGCVKIAQNTPLAEARFQLAGAAHEALMGRFGITHANDGLCAFREFVEHARSEGLTRQQWDELAPATLQEVTDFLCARWPLIVDVAAGFLAAQGARGSRIPYPAVDRLYREAHARMNEDSSSGYGSYLRAFLPAAEQHTQREIARACQFSVNRDLEDTLRGLFGEPRLHAL